MEVKRLADYSKREIEYLIGSMILHDCYVLEHEDLHQDDIALLLGILGVQCSTIFTDPRYRVSSYKEQLIKLGKHTMDIFHKGQNAYMKKFGFQPKTTCTDDAYQNQ